MPPKPTQPPIEPAGAKKRRNPRREIDVQAQREEVRREAMADLVKASRGGGLFSITQMLGSDERQDIMANGENAEAWKKLQRRSSQGWFSVLGPLLFFLAILILFAIALLLVLN